MWPFSKKDKEPTFEQQQERKAWDAIERLEKLYPKGSQFDYLGVKCLVVSTSEVWSLSFACGVSPVLKADYVDKNGVIRQLKLSYPEAMRNMGLIDNEVTE